ncbi:MAG TPA: hypothetical protein VGG02_02970 [Chthoniobacterales bacterium]
MKSLSFFFLFLCALGSHLPKMWAASAPHEVWISAVSGGDAGSGTSSDPYDGSTQAKFDALMTSFQTAPNLIIHLGAGTFRSDVTTDGRWVVEPGWTIAGAGMYLTTCQMMGNLKGQHWDHEFFKSPWNVSTDHVTISNLTVDCNWGELSQTADIGANGEKFGAIFAVALSGSHILIDQVRHTNSYGSWANLDEQFGIGLGAPSTGDVTGDIIRDCRAELPQGNYGSPYALHGWPPTDGGAGHFITNSSAYGNYAAGQNNGLTTGFTTGGINGAFIKDCQVYENIFIDCQSAYYQDTGSAESLKITGNTVTRGWSGVALVAAGDPTWTKSDITISNNQLNLQNRILDYGSASYGIAVSGALSTGLSISKNHISFTPTGNGYPQFLTISTTISDSTIANNTADEASAGTGIAAPVRGQVSGYSTSIADNRTPTGHYMTGLANTFLPALAKALNFSTRATVGTGDNVLIDGFIIAGSASKKVLIRALGPSLSKSGIAQPIADPTLTLYDSSGKVLATNDNWKQTQQVAIQATGIAPPNNAESALIITLPAGSYTAVMSGKNSTPGVGLVEAYDLTPTTTSSLQNVSTRGFVGTGENVMIGGLIIGQGQNPTVVARGLGPSLADAGIRNPLADPMLELHDSNGDAIAVNDNWRDTQIDAIKATGLAPTRDRESAIVESLPAGNYTTVLRGNHNSTGVALVEVYTLP